MSDSLVPVGVTTPTDANISFIFFVALYISDGPEHKVKQIPNALHKCYELRPKDVYQVHLGPHSVANHSTKTQTDLRANVQHVTNLTEQRTAEAARARPAGP